MLRKKNYKRREGKSFKWIGGGTIYQSCFKYRKRDSKITRREELEVMEKTTINDFSNRGGEGFKKWEEERSLSNSGCRMMKGTYLQAGEIGHERINGVGEGWMRELGLWRWKKEKKLFIVRICTFRILLIRTIWIVRIWICKIGGHFSPKSSVEWSNDLLCLVSYFKAACGLSEDFKHASGKIPFFFFFFPCVSR